MANTFGVRRVNPRLGTYFGIVASLIVAQFLLLMILEQLGTSDMVIRMAVLIGLPVLFVAIALVTATADSHEYFTAGRRVPAVCAGLVTAVATLGSTGLLAGTGTFYINGFDAWYVLIGATTGFLIMGIAVAPYLRKSGAYTLPSFLARRFQSRLLRLTAACVFVVPMLLVLCAELRMTLWAAHILAPAQSNFVTVGLIAVVSATLIAGGLRAVGWVSTAQSITVLIAIVTLAAMLGVLLTNFPVSQLSYGPVLRAIGRLESAQQVPVGEVSLLSFGIARDGLETVTTRFAAPFGTVGPISFGIAVAMVAAGVAASPWLLPFSGSTTGVYSARKAAGWAVFFFGLIIVSLSALGVFMRDYAMRDLVGRTPDDLPAWFTTLRDLGLARLKIDQGAIGLADFEIHRDAILFALPVAPGFPDIALYLVLAGVIAAGLAASSAVACAIANLLAEDVIGGLKWDPAPGGVRAAIARVTAAGVLAVGFVFVNLVHTDPLRLFLWAMGLTAATAFPVVILSVWWKRLTPGGALIAILTGFGIAAAAILLAEAGVLGLPPEVAPSLGLFPSLIAALVVSKLSPVPSRDVLEQIREMRIPGGETIYDREMRLYRQRQSANRT